MDKNTHQVTIFQNIKDTSTPFHRGVEVIFHRIRDGKSKDIVEKIRSYKDKNKRNEIKKDLPAICFSGEFNKRKDSSIINHSGLICLDFDNFESESKLKKRRKELEEDKYSMAVFTSPSGNGLKVIVKIPRDVDKHRTYFNSLQNYYDCEYFDVTCKNISRVCYESYDPNIYINLKSAEWTKVIEEDHEHINKEGGKVTIKLDNQDEIVRRLTLWWQNNYGMTEGERNNNAYVLASAFNDFGVNKELASFILKRFQMKGFPESEISAVINSAYQNAHKFNTKFFEDKDRVNSVRDKIRAGVSKKEIRSQLIDAGVEGDVADAVISEKENESNTLKFWNKNDRGVVSVIHFMFKAFLHDLGYFRYYPNGGNNFIFVKIRSNIVDNATEENIKDDVLKHL